MFVAGINFLAYYSAYMTGSGKRIWLVYVLPRDIEPAAILHKNAWYDIICEGG